MNVSLLGRYGFFPFKETSFYSSWLLVSSLRIPWEFKPEAREKILWRNAQKLLAHTAVGQMHFSL
jgi:hypothetical protein